MLKQSTGRRSYLAMVLSGWPKVFLKFTALHSQLCTCLCCSREDTKPTPSTNHKALGPLCHPATCYLTPSLQGFLGSLSAILIFLFHNAAPEHSHPQLGQGNPCHTNPFHPQQAGRGIHSPNPKHGWHRSPS